MDNLGSAVEHVYDSARVTIIDPLLAAAHVGDCATAAVDGLKPTFHGVYRATAAVVDILISTCHGAHRATAATVNILIPTCHGAHRATAATTDILISFCHGVHRAIAAFINGLITVLHDGAAGTATIGYYLGAAADGDAVGHTALEDGLLRIRNQGTAGGQAT